jgi:hypothetical protein
MLFFFYGLRYLSAKVTLVEGTLVEGVQLYKGTLLIFIQVVHASQLGQRYLFLMLAVAMREIR